MVAGQPVLHPVARDEEIGKGTGRTGAQRVAAGPGREGRPAFLDDDGLEQFGLAHGGEQGPEVFHGLVDDLLPGRFHPFVGRADHETEIGAGVIRGGGPRRAGWRHPRRAGWRHPRRAGWRHPRRAGWTG